MHNSIRGILSWHFFFQTRCVRLCFWGHQFQLRFADLDCSIDSDKAWQTMGKLTTNPSKLIPNDWFHYGSLVLHQTFYKSKRFSTFQNIRPSLERNMWRADSQEKHVKYDATHDALNIKNTHNPQWGINMGTHRTLQKRQITSATNLITK